MLKVALTNLGKYNEGDLVYTWLKLPATDDEIKKALEKIEVKAGGRYEEYFISDYETDINIKISEYDNLDELNELVELIENLDSSDIDKLRAIVEWGYYGTDIDSAFEAIEHLDEFSLWYDVRNESDLGEAYLELLDDIPDYIKYYIDTERYGRDISLEKDGCFTNFGWVERC
jgi:antirestriction protein